MSVTQSQYDLVVIGGGPGGYVAAIRAAQLGMTAAVVEKDKVGGICLNWGCIPTKALLRNAEVLSLFRRAGEFGISYENLRVDYSAVVKRSRRVVDRLTTGVEHLLRKNKVAVIPGTGRLLSATEVEVTGPQGKERLRSRYILLATGSRPKEFPGLAPDGKRVITSNEAVVLSEVPRSLIVLGAGAVGVEFADIFRTFGSEVTLIEMMPTVLPVEDKEVSTHLARTLTKKGITILTEAVVEKVTVTGAGVRATVTVAGKSQEVKGDVLLVAVGRVGNVEGLGLEAVGVAVERGFVKVTEAMETTVPGISAIGDVAGPPLLAHKATAEGVVAVERMARLDGGRVDYGAIPSCTYCQPQVASIGMTEEKAKAAGRTLSIGRFPFQANGKALAMGETEGFVKILADAETGEILGVHILGSEATEMIAEVGLARTLESTPEEISRTIHAHPTLSEALMEASLATLGRVVHL